MSETEFTTKVVIPMLVEMGYKSDHFGGPYEQGKDIICWKENEFGDTECHVAQVKKLEPRVSTRTQSSFSDLINQLQQACEKLVPGLDGKKQLPDRITFITPYDIDTRSLESRFEMYQQLRSRRVRILDGSKIAQLFGRYCPTLANALAGHGGAIEATTLSNLSNDVLMRALKAHDERSIEQFYCDLDFSIGRRTNSLLLLNNAAGTPVINVAPERLEAIEQLDEVVQRTLKVKLVIDREEIDAQRATRNERIKQCKVESSRSKVQPVKGRKRSYKPWLSEFEGSSKNLYNLLKLSNRNVRAQAHFHRLNRIASILTDRKWFAEIARIHVVWSKTIQSMVKSGVITSSKSIKLQSKFTDLQFLIKEYNAWVAQVLSSPYVLRINICDLSTQCAEKCSYILMGIEQINRGILKGSALKKFLGEVESLMDTFDTILGNTELMRAIEEGTSDGRFLELGTRISSGGMVVKADAGVFFDTGVNFCVFGDAGAGKTTTLQMYAKRQLEVGVDRLVLYIPLAALTDFNDSDDDSKYDPSMSVSLLVNAMCKFINQTSSSYISEPIFTSMLSAGKPLLLLDGVDESVRECHWLLDALWHFPKQFENVQVVTSSRNENRLLAEIPFIGITLRDFSPQQRDTFITRWFALAANSKRDYSRDVIEHLKKSTAVAEIIKNPLSATILCVLAENNVPLPEREVQLYAQRLRLLLGEYDLHKRIHRIESSYDVLRKVAVKLAFCLHTQNRRFNSLEWISRESVSIFSGRIEEELVKRAVRELVEPCNVLIPMDYNGSVGFGHLRFQEYLVACELLENRNLDIVQYLYVDWWRGPLVLFSQMTDDIEFLFREAHNRGEFNLALPTLGAMLKNRSQADIDRIDAFLESVDSAKSGVHDTYVSDDYEYRSRRGESGLNEEFEGSPIYRIDPARPY
ncbi:MAG: NACHT domain-containing protein [Verrucomicrobiales bacterium]|nr:NACHT domain-containing protein [Verrucomicrobiales bacterium]